jgi:hypothetical protein
MSSSTFYSGFKTNWTREGKVDKMLSKERYQFRGTDIESCRIEARKDLSLTCVR